MPGASAFPHSGRLAATLQPIEPNGSSLLSRPRRFSDSSPGDVSFDSIDAAVHSEGMTADGRGIAGTLCGID